MAAGPCGAGARDLVGAAELAWRSEPWPNPFNPLVRARVELARPAFVIARVYDLRGRAVATLLEGNRDAGVHDLRWDGTRDGRPAEAGTYLLRISGQRTVLTRKLMLLK